jgi:hypothetical protein
MNWTLSRTEVRTATACPTCGALRGENCRRTRPHPKFGWVRFSNHRERVHEAERSYPEGRQQSAGASR